MSVLLRLVAIVVVALAAAALDTWRAVQENDGTVVAAVDPSPATIAGATAPPAEPAPTAEVQAVAAAAPSPPTRPATSVAAPITDAPATTAPTIEQRGLEALALVPFAWQRTGYQLIFAGHRDGYLGLTSTTQKTITIYIRSSQTPRQIAKVIAHELGHAVDVEFTSEAERVIYRRIRGIDARSWYPDCSGCTDYDSPAGDFAETFAVAMVGDANFLSTVAAPPTVQQLQALVPVFTV